MRKSKISFLLEYKEIGLLEKILYLEPCLADSLQRIRKEKDKYRIAFLKDYFQETLDALFFQADLVQSEEEKQCLLNLHEKMRGYMVLAKGFRESAFGRLS